MKHAGVLSETELVAALATGARNVSITDLITWRRNGLLPQLVGHGVGIAKGKAYCWHDPDIVRRAELVYDALRQYGRNDMALLMLFLSGFSVPLPQLRRAWAGRAKFTKPPAIRPAPRSNPRKSAQNAGPLLEIALAIGGAIRTDHHVRMAALVERAMAKLGFVRGNEEIGPVLMAMEPALEASGLVGVADEAEIAEAQRYLVLGLAFLRGCAEGDDRENLTAIAGPSLFLFILTLLRSGQRGAIDAFVARIGEQARPAAVRAIWTRPRQSARQAGVA